MGLTRNQCAKWVFLFLLPSIIILFSHSLVRAQWHLVYPQGITHSNLSGVHFTSADEGWAVGTDGSTANWIGVMFHYQNGTWTKVTPPTVSGKWSLQAVHFTSADEGWAVGSNHENHRGVFLHYQSGTWTLVTPSTGFTYWSAVGVHFTSADEGWAVGSEGDYTTTRGALLHYQSGTWTLMTPPTVSDYWGLNSVHFTSATDGCAVGFDGDHDRGVLLHYLGPVPNEGTIGTKLTIRGSSFGSTKGKVLIGGVATKIAKDGWKPDSITCTVTKVPLPAGVAHDVTITSKEIGSFTYVKTFTVKPPMIDVPLDIDHGVAGITPITITGNFFSTKKGKVYLEYEKNGLPKKKYCKVTFWGMDSITFIVPKGLVSGTAYPLKVINKVGIVGAPSDFTID